MSCDVGGADTAAIGSEIQFSHRLVRPGRPGHLPLTPTLSPSGGEGVPIRSGRVRGPCPRADALGYFLSALRAFTRPAKICCGLACLAGRDQPIPSVELRQRWPRGTGSLPKPVPITFVGIHRRPAREHKSTARTAVLRPIFSPFLPISFYCLQLECAEVESCS